MLKPIKRNIAKQLATTAVGRTTGEKKIFFFLVATCFCYLLEVTAPKKKKFVYELTLTFDSLVDSGLVKTKKKFCVIGKSGVFIFFREMNCVRHYATYGNTRDFRPEDEEKPSGTITFLEPAWSDSEIGRNSFRRY